MAVPVNVIVVAAGISGVIVMQEQKTATKSNGHTVCLTHNAHYISFVFHCIMRQW